MQQRFDAVRRLSLHKEQGMDEDIADCQHVLPEEKVFRRVFFLGWAEVLAHINALLLQVV